MGERVGRCPTPRPLLKKGGENFCARMAMRVVDSDMVLRARIGYEIT